METMLLFATVLLVVCADICGLWLRSNPSKKDESSLRFHAAIGLIALLAGAVAAGGAAFLGW